MAAEERLHELEKAMLLVLTYLRSTRLGVGSAVDILPIEEAIKRMKLHIGTEKPVEMTPDERISLVAWRKGMEIFDSAVATTLGRPTSKDDA